MKTTNSEPYISKYLHSKGRKMGLPVSGSFELTARCNFNCPMCYVHMSESEIQKRGKELSAQQWLEIAEEAKNRGMLFALLTGGEPLLRKDFFEIYDGMRKMGLIVSINTNGSLLQGEILQKFLENPPARFNISLYGGCNETYQNMCGIPAYDRVKENIRALRKAGVEVSLNLCITQYNWQDLEKIYADAVELDVNVRVSSYSYPSIRVNGEQYGCNNRFSAEEAAKCMVEWDLLRCSKEQFLERAERLLKLQTATNNDDLAEEGEGVRCRAGSTSFWMTWDGKMLPCGMMTEPVAYPLETGFEAAWEDIRKQTAMIRTPSKCATCNYKDVCGVCAAVCYTETGKFNEVPKYICSKIEETIRITKKCVDEMEIIST